MDTNQKTNEHEYTKPVIEDHGTLAELTAGQGFGTELDHAFPTGTKSTALTFSGPNP
jgi:hypothetical protein